MNTRFFYGVIAILVIGFIVLIFVSKQSETPRPGVAHEDKGREHVEKKDYKDGELPTSGPHAAPVAWGVYETEQRDDQLIHNLEHGGIVVTYRPDVTPREVEQLELLLAEPFSEPGFKPMKVVVAPRKLNKEKIVLSSWQRSATLDTFEKEAIMTYVKRNLGKSPEPLAG